MDGGTVKPSRTHVIYEVTYPDNRQEWGEPLLAYFRTHSSAVNFARDNKGGWRRKLCSTSELGKLENSKRLGP